MTNQKNIFAIAPQADYLKTLAQFIYSQCGGDLLALSRVRIILPNHRSTLKIKEDFIDISPNKAVILPEIISLGDLDEEGAEINKVINSQLSAEMKPAISSEKKLFLLAKMIRENSGQSFNLGDISFEAALKLASSLSTLLDDVEKHELTISNLENILPEELSKHRQISLDFIRFIFAEYPKMLDKIGFSDRARKTNLLINGFAESLQNDPPKDAIFIAGSTGSIPATRRLMKVISRLPNGHVILPFTDFSLNSFEWDELENEGNETNNQKPIHKLLKFLEATRADIKMLNAEQDSRSATISQLMKSAALMDSWKKNKVGDIGWIKLIEAKNPIDEAKLVSAVIRHKLSQNKSVALITNNKDMAEKVRLFVQRFGMNVDDSSGITLDRTEEGAALLEAAHLISSGFRITNMLSLFKLAKISGVEELEKNVIRKNNIKYVSELKNIPNSLSAVISSVTKNIQPSESLKNLVSATYEIINALNPSLKLAGSEAWEKIEDLVNGFIETDSGQKIEGELFANCLQVLLSGKKIWPKYIPNKNVAILSPIEARLQHFDCVILGDLTLGSWPAGKFSPWLSRNMFKSMELPFEEETIALSAHDFASHLHTAEVFVSMSEYIAGEPVIESPFISRLKAFYKAMHGGSEIECCNDYDGLIAELDGDDAPRKTYELPKVKPPAEARIKKLSVTQIEKLIKNPYAVYASEILALKKLDEIDKDAEAKDYGNFVHKVLEDFTKNHALDTAKITEEEFLKIAAKTHQDFAAKNLANQAWLAQINKISQWFVKLESGSSQNLKQLISESKGRMEIEVGGKKFTLTCKADRIEIGNDNSVNIADYKTGFIPKQLHVQRLVAPQLLLEALMIKNSAFEEIKFTDIKYELGNIVYYNVSFSNNGPDKKTYSDIDLEQLLPEVERELNGLIADLQDPEVPYLIRPYPKLQPEFDDYEHLERVEG